MSDREADAVESGADAGTGQDLMVEGRSGPRQAPRSRGSLVVLGAVAVVLAAIVFRLATGAGSVGARVPTPSPKGDPTAVLDAALTDGRPAYILAHSAT